MPRPKKNLENERAFQLINCEPIYVVFPGPPKKDWTRVEFAGKAAVVTEPLEAWRLNKLPTDPNLHIRGIVGEEHCWYCEVDFGRSTYYPRIHKKPRKGSKARAVKFHSWPTTDTYGDIPPREDIYSFVKWPTHEIHIHIGPNKISLLTKNLATDKVREQLQEWEEKHQYDVLMGIRRRAPNETQEEHYRRYTNKALRVIGFDHVPKPSKRRQQWMAQVRAIGIDVEQVDRKRAGRLIRFPHHEPGQ